MFPVQYPAQFFPSLVGCLSPSFLDSLPGGEDFLSPAILRRVFSGHGLLASESKPDGIQKALCELHRAEKGGPMAGSREGSTRKMRATSVPPGAIAQG